MVTEKMKERWQGIRMHGHFLHNLDEKLVDNEQSCRWLKFGSAVMAAQDQAVSTTYFEGRN
jgi:hypothetical protein